eukprot:COSAG03_NODE_16364_length_404_cov_0.652459_1_plen_68_part_10
MRLDQRFKAAHMDQPGLPFFVTRTRREHVLAKYRHGSVSERHTLPTEAGHKTNAHTLGSSGNRHTRHC